MGTMLSSGEAMAVQTNSLVDSSLKEPNPMAEGKLRVAPVQTIIDAENDLQTNFPAKGGAVRTSKTAALASSHEAEPWQTLRAPASFTQTAFCDTFRFTLFTLFGFTMPEKRKRVAKMA